MNFVACSIIAMASVGFLSQCKPKESAAKQGESSHAPPAGNGKKLGSRSGSSDGKDKDYKDTQGLAMNRNEVMNGLLTRAKPDWLSIGSPAAAEALADKHSVPDLKNVGESKLTFSAGATLGKVGDLELPASLAGMEWSASSFNSKSGRLLMVPLEMTEPAYLFKVEAGKIQEDSREEVPSINYDDKRRWFIQWETWISDTEIVGVLNEEDLSGHKVTRSGLYLYEVNSRELRRVDLPYGFVAGEEPSIEIVSVSPDGLVINTTDGEKVVSLKR